MYDMIATAAHAERERRVRSELCRLLSAAVLIKESLSWRATVCGKAGCRCRRGHKHRSVCLVANDTGRVRQQHVRRVWQARVRETPPPGRAGGADHARAAGDGAGPGGPSARHVPRDWQNGLPLGTGRGPPQR